jgi:hypothetical protein
VTDDEKIAEFYEAVKAKAREEVEVETGQRQVLEEFDQPARDQLEKELTDRASLLGIYWRKLLAGGIDPDSAMWLLRDEADYMRECGA